MRTKITVFSDRIELDSWSEGDRGPSDAPKAPLAVNAEAAESRPISSVEFTSSVPPKPEANSVADPSPGPGSAATDVPAQVNRLVDELLGIGSLAADDDLIELGANSLMLTRMVALIHDDMGVSVSVEEILEARTKAKLIDLVQSRVGSPAEPAKKPVQEFVSPQDVLDLLN